MVIKLTNRNKVGKIDIVDIKVKYSSLIILEIKSIKKKLFLHFTLIKRNQKTYKFGIYLKNQFRYVS